MFEKLNKLEECLVDSLCEEFEKGIHVVDAHEAFEIVDMIKDLSEAKYYCVVTEAAKEGREMR